MRTIREVLSSLRAEFEKMPGLRLRAVQVQRLCRLEPTVCQVVLQSLVDEEFLCREADGAYVECRRRHQPCEGQLQAVPVTPRPHDR